MPSELQTERLILRRLTREDVDAIFAVLGDRVAMQFYSRAFTREDAAEWIERNLRRYEADGHGLLAVVLKENDEVIGDCGVIRQSVEGESMLEVGYHLRRNRWGHGYASEAARRCIQFGFEELGAQKIVSLIRAENGPSRRVAERNGMEVERGVTYAGLPHLLYTICKQSYERNKYGVGDRENNSEGELKAGSGKQRAFAAE
jgi:ribosomal-protein-alanine N-acetyltransferase